MLVGWTWMTRSHGAVWISWIRKIDIPQRYVAGAILACLVNAAVDRIVAEDRMRSSLSGGVVAQVVSGQPRRLLPFVNPCPVRVDGMNSR
jgi:hypothetical protein